MVYVAVEDFKWRSLTTSWVNSFLETKYKVTDENNYDMPLFREKDRPKVRDELIKLFDE
jgi:hypothetical protein